MFRAQECASAVATLIQNIQHIHIHEHTDAHRHTYMQAHTDAGATEATQRCYVPVRRTDATGTRCSMSGIKHTVAALLLLLLLLGIPLQLLFAPKQS